MKAKLWCLLLTLFLASLPAFAQEPAHHHDSPEDLGTVNFPVSCAPEVRKTFTRGMALLYSFEYEQAQRAFESAAQKDPACAMAYWGQAMSFYHQLWDRPPRSSLERGAELLEKASGLKATPREKDYIAALTVFYGNWDQQKHEERAGAYSKAMKSVVERNPDDHEAAVFYALSLLGSSPEDDKELNNAKEAVAILTKLFEAQPDHPGIAHYIIHSCDNPRMAGLALPAARKYAAIAPASAHAVHMPSHIFARLGLWQDDIQSNLRAIEIADQQARMHVHTMHHRVHSMDFLAYAYLQVGDDARARAQLDRLAKMHVMHGDEDFMQDYLQTRQSSFPVLYALERRQWREALSLEPAKDWEPYAQTPVYWGHAVAAGHLRDAAAAQDALNHYDELVAATRKGQKAYIVDSMKQGRKEMQAWADFAAGKEADALRQLKEVAEEQDQVGKGETDLPAREMLADMLLNAGKAQDALEQYEISLQTDPNRFNGLAGAAAAAQRLQQKEKAAGYYAQLLKNCSGSHSERPELQQAKLLVAAN
jgi:tetratricopeptide (TPR) repeat protein